MFRVTVSKQLKGAFFLANARFATTPRRRGFRSLLQKDARGVAAKSRLLAGPIRACGFSSIGHADTAMGPAAREFLASDPVCLCLRVCDLLWSYSARASPRVRFFSIFMLTTEREGENLWCVR